jgi:hypothetical protein
MSIKQLLIVVMLEPFRILNDFIFDNDAHNIVSKKGWKILNNEQNKEDE